MIINLFIASLVILSVFGILLSIEKALPLITQLFRMLIKWSKRSKMLTEYLIRAYLRYKKNINKHSFNY
jgi:hypothetical protein